MGLARMLVDWVTPVGPMVTAPPAANPEAVTASSWLVPRQTLDGAQQWSPQANRPAEQRKAMHHARHIFAIQRSAQALGAVMGDVRWRAMTAGPDGEMVADPDPLAGAYAATLNAETAWATRAAELLVMHAESFLVLSWGGVGLRTMTLSARSISEVDAQSRPWRLRDNASEKGRPFGDLEHVVRIWTPDPEWSSVAWSPLMSQQASALCDDILIGEALKLASTKSQRNAGVFLVPIEVFNSMRPLLVRPDGTPVENLDMVRRFTSFFDGSAEGQTVEDTVTPLLLSAQAKALEGVRHVTIEARVDVDKFIAEQDHRTRQLASLLPTPDTVLTGLGEMNHWNGQLDLDNADRLYWRPAARWLADAITAQHYRAWLTGLAASGLYRGDPTRARISPDTTKLTEIPYDPATVLAMREAGMLTDEAAGRRLGLTRSDMPSRSEREQQVNPDEAPQAATPQATPARQVPASAERAVTAAAVGGCGSQAALDALAVALERIDAATVGKVEAIAAARLADALDAAGFSVKRQAIAEGPTSAWRAMLPAKNAAGVLTLGLDGIVAAVGIPEDLSAVIAAAIDRATPELEAVFLAALERARAAVASAVCGDRADVDRQFERQHRHAVEEASAMIVGALFELATRLGMQADGPVASVPSIPMSVVRRAMSVAGGSSLNIDAGAAPAQGAAAGSWVIGALTGLLGGGSGRGPAGAKTATLVYEVLRWVHDNPANPFNPHVELHNREVLAMSGFGGYYPGDHKGCRCLISSRWVVAPIASVA